MSQIVHDPGSEELVQGDEAKRRVLALEGELSIGELPGRERREVLRSQFGEFVEQLSERLPLALTELRGSIERFEPSLRALGENDLGARNPVCALAVDHVS